MLSVTVIIRLLPVPPPDWKKAKEGTLFAEAREVSCSRKIASYAIDVTDKTGEKTAVFQGMVYRKDVDLISRQD